MDIPTTFTDYKNSLGKYFPIKDWIAVDIVNAVVIAHYIPGESIWLRLLGPSRSGRTELLRPIVAYPEAVEIEVLTPSAIKR